MTYELLLFSVALTQAVQAPATPARQAPAEAAATAGQPAAAVRLDQVELRDGEVLEGRIVLEVGNYVEIELEPGAVVGFRTTEVAAIRRGVVQPAPAPAPAIAARDSWFTLYDGAGSAVGWLHCTATPVADGGVRLLEEWEFGQGQRWFQVTALETADAALRPKSSYFRERVREGDGVTQPSDPLARQTRVREERIVEATVQGDVLVVTRLMPDGRTERQLPWPEGATFPLLARLQHGGQVGADVREFTIFDAAVEELQTRTFTAVRQRRIAVDGRDVLVEETVEQTGNGRNAVWRDASNQVVRREIAGPSLVAVPSAEESARRAVGNASLPAPFVAEPEGRFGLWRPNPAWEARATATAAAALACTLHDADISLSLVDHLDPGTALESAASAVERWARLMDPALVVDGRDWTRLRDREAVRMDCSSGQGPTRRRSSFWVLGWQDDFLVLRCSAPAAVWDELRADFDAVAAHLELVPGAVAALQPDAEAPDGH